MELLRAEFHLADESDRLILSQTQLFPSEDDSLLRYLVFYNRSQKRWFTEVFEESGEKLIT